MELGEITDEIRQSYQANCYTRLGYALRAQLAARLKAEQLARAYKALALSSCSTIDLNPNTMRRSDEWWQTEAHRILTGQG